MWVFTGEVGRDELALLLGEVDERRHGLRESHEEEVVDSGLHHSFEQWESVVIVRQQIRITEEGEADVVAGGADDHVDVLGGAVREVNLLSVEFGDGRLEGYVA